MVKRGNLRVIEGGKGKPVTVSRQVLLQNAWQRRQDARNAIVIARSPEEAYLAKQEFLAADWEYIQIACDVAGIPRWLRRDVSRSQVADSGNVDIIYMDPFEYDDYGCLVYPDCKVHHYRPPHLDELPPEQELLALVK